jgi:hypothetical protein
LVIASSTGKKFQHKKKTENIMTISDKQPKIDFHREQLLVTDNGKKQTTQGRTFSDSRQIKQTIKQHIVTD